MFIEVQEIYTNTHWHIQNMHKKIKNIHDC